MKSIHNETLNPAEVRSRLRAFLERRGTEFSLTRLGYFGSYARGTAQPGSDIDVVFETTHPDLLTTSLLKQALESWMGRPVDVVRRHPYLHPTFRNRLEQEAIYL